jgi:hypothetical protein
MTGKIYNIYIINGLVVSLDEGILPKSKD